MHLLTYTISIYCHLNQRYSKSRKCMLNPRFAWCFQESPALILPLVFLFTKDKENKLGKQTLILLLYVWHYFYRSFVYPLQISGRAQKIWFFPCLLAFSFNLFNGSMQTLGTFQKSPPNFSNADVLCNFSSKL